MIKIILGLVESDFQGKIAVVSKGLKVISHKPMEVEHGIFSSNSGAQPPHRMRWGDARRMRLALLPKKNCSRKISHVQPYNNFTAKSAVQIGVLDIQGSVEEHLAALKKLGISPVAVKTKGDLDKVDGLIIPGGESTTIGKLLDFTGLDKEILRRADASKKSAGTRPLAVWGTCAGAILIAKKVISQPPQGLPLMDIEIERNAYGRQLDSFEAEILAPEVSAKPIPAVFIRAPIIKKASPKAKILAKYGGEPVMVRQGALLATTFHPELTNDSRVLSYFIKIVRENASKKEPD